MKVIAALHGPGPALLEPAFRAEVAATGATRLQVNVDDDVKGALNKLKPEVALYVGGMGHKDKNYHKDIMVRRGFKEAADRIQELYLAQRKEEAAAAVPDE